MATTVWLDRPTHSRLVALKQERGLTSIGAAIRFLLDEPVESAQAIYARRAGQVDATCAAHGVRRLIAFGSRVRGDARVASDLDIAAEFADNVGLEFVDALAAIEQAFACPADVIPLPRHRPGLMANIEREGVVLYERS